jgi:hypothetical protein
VPRFVERELREFLDCGILAHGFLRVHCDACGKDRLVAYSCKGRAFCPSCGGRRMADTAAHLVDRVFPEVPVRQWVLSLPFALRYRLAYDASLVSAVLRVFLRAVFASTARRAREHFGIGQARCGSVTFVQRFGGAVNLNVHLHTLALDGVYVTHDPGGVHFLQVPPPDDAEVARVTLQVARRIAKLLERRGLAREADPEAVDPLSSDEPLLAALYAAAVHGRVATGPRAGQRITRLGDRIDAEDVAAPRGPRCAEAAGVSVHANVAVPGRDRERLERLVRYVARPAVATERLSLLPDGRVLYALKNRWRDGTTHVAFEPVDFVARLAALVPPPRFHLVRYSGILAPAARFRAQVVPEGPGPTQPVASHPGCPARGSRDAAAPPGPDRAPTKRNRPRPRNYSWAELMRRVFLVDVLECADCHGRMRILAAIHSPEAIRAILECLGLPSRAPPIAAAATDPETDGIEPDIDFDDA